MITTIVHLSINNFVFWLMLLLNLNIIALTDKHLRKGDSGNVRSETMCLLTSLDLNSHSVRLV